MIKIDYEIDRAKTEKDIKDFEEGYYLVKQNGTGDLSVISISGKMIHFLHADQSYPSFCQQDNYATFFHHYALIGKIKNFTITEIELEK